MNKAGTWLVIVVVMLLLVWYWQQRPEPQNQAVINVVSQAENQSTQNKNKQSSTIATQIVDNNTDKNSRDSETPDESIKQRTFMAIYRDLMLAESCSQFYIFHHDNKGDYDYLTPLHNAANYQRGEDGGAPAIQVEALERFYDDCLQLKRNVFSRAGITEDYPKYQFAYPVIVELRKEWRASKPVTTAEKQLAKAVTDSERWLKSLNQLRQISWGEYALTDEERKEIRQMVITISDEIEQLYLQTDQVDQTAVDLLTAQIQTLNKKKDRRLAVDEAKRNEALALFLSHTNQLNRHLYTGNPDSFYQAIKHLELDDSFNLAVVDEHNKNSLQTLWKKNPEYLPPSQHLFELSGQLDKTIYNLLLEPASLLFMCYLGDDCGADSAHSRKYCLGEKENHRNSFPAACDQALVDFYTDDYLSPNQWQDVQQLFNLMVTTYAP